MTKCGNKPMLDRLKYEVTYRLWTYWHSELRWFIDTHFVGSVQTYMCRNRPWWHLCCNGNEGGWRTDLCDWLEHIWRGTDHYARH